MATPSIDSNQWYSLYVNKTNSSALKSTNNFSRDQSAGASFFTTTNHSAPTQRWQIYGINSTTFVLRTQEGGETLFLGSQAADKNGLISPLMLRGDVADASVFWQFGAWGDDTYYMWNGGNGTGYHLARNETGSGICMNNNIAAPQNKQRWSFDAVAAIDDKAYSTVAVSLPFDDEKYVSKDEIDQIQLRDAAVTATATTSSSPTASSSTTASAATGIPSSPPSTGLSTGGKIGLGVALGVAVLIALIVVGLFLRRRRNQKRASPAEMAYEPYHGQPQGAVEPAPALPNRRAEHYRYELDHDTSAAKYEMPVVETVKEAQGDAPRAELPGYELRR